MELSKYLPNGVLVTRQSNYQRRYREFGVFKPYALELV